ncbi:uncharacterized protein LOC143855796 [Tasmannia lanceolata]|uniref:uncharacterized protein LOC143855796 n=1 Tax=Tasmannia lanceolata TaxID=3420 RepID=UPI0040646EC7
MQLLKIYYTVTDAKPTFGEDDAAEDAQWERDNDFCKCYLLNSISNHLVDVYTQKESAKEIWDGLVQQYRDDEKLSKTHLINKFLDMEFEDDKEVLPQVKELEKLVQKLKEEKVELDNPEEEEANQVPEEKAVEQKSNLNVQKKTFKKENCYNCGKPGHYASACKAPKKESVAVVENFVAMVLKAVDPSNVSDWWLDTGATFHICANKSLFSTYTARSESVAMADRSSAAVLGVGTVVVELTSGKTLTPKDVKHVPSIAKNLISGSLPCDAGMRLDF